MSLDPTFSTSDLRSTAQDYKRDATHKHKWALGPVETAMRAAGKPKPQRPSKTEFSFKRRQVNFAVASTAHGIRVARKYDMLEGAALSDDSSGSTSDEHDEAVPSVPVDAGVMYSFDAASGPSQGSQILTLALSKAVERFEERETTKLVCNEYDVLDSDGETVPVSPEKKRKNKGKHALIAAVPDVDEDYEFV